MTAEEAVSGERDWLYNEASGVLYGPDPDHPGLRYPFATNVEEAIGHRIAEAMNRAALPPSPAEEAVKRVEAVAEELDEHPYVTFSAWAVASRIRTALASPAPAPQGEVQRAIPDALVPDVRALIERAEKRAVARALREAADAVRHQLPGYIGRIDTADSLDDRAAALDPS